MWEIRFHGRGGQGAVVASELLAQAAFLDGKWPQSFPFFGVERRGAPVTSYTRIDDRPVGLRTSIQHPDAVVVLESGLLGGTPVTEGMKEGGVLVVNAASGSRLPEPASRYRVARLDATRIAVAHGLGTATMPIVNTTMLGALARVTGVVGLEALGRAIDGFVPSRAPENRAAAEDGFRSVQIEAPTARPPPAPTSVPPVVRVHLPEGPLALRPSSVRRTAAWRTLTPVIERSGCTRCNFCWKYCPDDAIALDPEGYPTVSLDYCKGCGICAEVCPPRAIAMVAGAGEAAP